MHRATAKTWILINDDRALLPAGAVCRRGRVVEHNVVNEGTATISFIETELK